MIDGGGVVRGGVSGVDSEVVAEAGDGAGVLGFRFLSVGGGERS